VQDGGAAATKCKLMDQLSLEGDVIERHPSMTAAAKSVTVAKSTMSNIIKDRREYANHFWQYVDGNKRGGGVEVPRRPPTKHDVAGSEDKHPSAKDVQCQECGRTNTRQLVNCCNTCQQCFHHKALCSHLKERVERPDGSEGGSAAGGSARRGEQGRRSCTSAADSFGSFITPKDQG